MPPVLVFFRAVARFGSSVKKSLSPRLNGQIVPFRDLMEDSARNAGKQGPVSLPRWPASPRRAGPGHALSLHAFPSYWAPLPAPAELLGIRRRGDRPFRALGRWMDGTRPHPAVPPLGNGGAGFRARYPARAIALVLALALRTLARPQGDAAELVAQSDLPAISGSTLTCVRRQRVSNGDTDGRADLSRRRTPRISLRHNRS